MLSAAFIELAVRGYIRINELSIKKLVGSRADYELEIIKDPSPLAQEQRDALSAFFGGSLAVGSRQTVSAQKNKLASKLSSIGKYLAADLTQKGYFASDPSKIRSRYIFIGSGLLIAGLVLSFIGVGLVLILPGLIVLGFSHFMPAHTPLGVTTRDYLLGLEVYIKMAEAERLRYLQSPQGAEKRRIDPNDPKQQVKLFEDLLPYAMLFGQEKEWAKQFQSLYTEAPSWYNSTSGTFNAIYLADALGGFSSANATAFSAPSSSSSSGFGGGGFSGGGGGGGGGGGW
jgi:uncharacterized membrane protein YgcG